MRQDSRQFLVPSKIASVNSIRQIEAAADASGLPYAQMMQNAGAGACRALLARVPVNSSTRVLFLIGKGNNGGDGLVMAALLSRIRQADIHLYMLAARDESDPVFRAAQDADLPMTLAADDADFATLRNLAGNADVIVDALLGIGGKPPLRPPVKAVVDTVGAATGDSRPFTLAMDCPSGMDCDAGAIDDSALPADATISFIAAKPGLLTFPAAAAVGELAIDTIGIPSGLPELRQINATLMDRAQAKSLLPARPLDGHKGAFGKAMLAVGSANYIGAAALAAEAAGRAGAGLVTVATTRPNIDIVAGDLREPTWLPLADIDGCIAESSAQTIADNAAGYSSLLVGCGLGLHESTQGFVTRLLDADSLPPLILDADALNALSRADDWWLRLPSDTIITPHAGEMARLTGLSSREIVADRWRIASEYAQRWQVVLLLKGAHTIIAAPDGQTSVVPFKTDALGTAGTGDVLAGLIAGLRAQGLSAYGCACLGAYTHAQAGIIAARNIGSSRSVIAGDVLDSLGQAFAEVEAG